MTIEELLENSYIGISEKETNQKSEIYYSILQIKNENRDFCDLEQSIYKDIKKFIINYIDCVEEKDFGYDFIDINKIINSIEIETSPNARIELYSFSVRLLKSKNHDELVDKLLKKRILSKFEHTLCDKSWYNGIKALLIISSYNFLTILLSLFVLSLFGLLIEQNSIFNCFELFNFEYESFCKTEILNQFLNIVAKPLGLAEKFKIIPLNIFAVFMLIIFKCIYLGIVVNFMFAKIKDNLIR